MLVNLTIGSLRDLQTWRIEFDGLAVDNERLALSRHRSRPPHQAQTERSEPGSWPATMHRWAVPPRAHDGPGTTDARPARIGRPLGDQSRLATGGGFAARRLHTDREMITFEGQRPVLLNGIPPLTGRPDLADRSVTVRLRILVPESRDRADSLWANFNTARPRILGAIFTAVSAAVRNIGKVRLERPPRMADFASWVTAAEPDLAPPSMLHSSCTRLVKHLRSKNLAAGSPFCALSKRRERC
jgi:hypothetical protein